MRSHLYYRILAALAVVGALLLGVLWLVQDQVIGPSFLALEERQARANLERATGAIADEVQQVDEFLSDWSGWDDTYRFVQDGNAEFRKSNLEQDVFRDNSFDFLCLVRSDGSLAWRDGQLHGERELVPELPPSPWPLDHLLLSPRQLDASVAGVLVTTRGPLLLASRPITDSARTAPARGWILMGRFLHAERIAALGSRLRLPLQVLTTDRLEHPDDRAAQARLAGATADLERQHDDLLVARTMVPPLLGAGALLVRLDLPRLTVAQGRATMRFALVATAGSILVLFGALLWLLRRMVLRPLATLTEHALRIRATGDLTRRCDLPRVDELGQLAGEFDAMVGRLGAVQAQLVEHAWAGGRAEVAASVLHDVGNALQGLQASVGALQQVGPAPVAEDLARLAALVAAHADDLPGWFAADPRARQLPVFLQGLQAALVAERAAQQAELAGLSAGIEHIRALIDRQQDHGAVPAATEVVRLGDLLHEAVRIACGPRPAAVVAVRGELEARLAVEKHRLLAVLVNLLRNAQQAVAAQPADRRQIDVEAGRGPGGNLHLVVADNGIGIAAEAMPRLFQRGHTTKPDGHGLGLHGCALAVQAMGGAIRATSAGPGAGARFEVELPAALVVAEVGP